MGLSTISRAKRDQTWREDVVTNGIGRVEGIAVDWIAGEWRLRRENYSESSKEEPQSDTIPCWTSPLSVMDTVIIETTLLVLGRVDRGEP